MPLPVIIFLLLLLLAITALAWRWRRHIGYQQQIIEQQQRQIAHLKETLAASDRQKPAGKSIVKQQPAVTLPDLDKLAQNPSQSGSDLRQGIKAFMAGDYEKAAAILPAHAEAGHVKAQTILAKMYFSGHGVEANQERYRYWLQRAADSGHKPSKAKLKKMSRS